jgi:hypothetical protein
MIRKLRKSLNTEFSREALFLFNFSLAHEEKRRCARFLKRLKSRLAEKARRRQNLEIWSELFSLDEALYSCAKSTKNLSLITSWILSYAALTEVFHARRVCDRVCVWISRRDWFERMIETRWMSEWMLIEKCRRTQHYCDSLTKFSIATFSSTSASLWINLIIMTMLKNIDSWWDKD